MTPFTDENTTFLSDSPLANSAQQSATNSSAEEKFRLSDLPKYIPPGRNGKRRHKSEAYRYVNPGIRGIKLEVEQLPDGLYTTLAAWNRFVQRLTEARLGTAISSAAEPPKQKIKQQRAVEAEIEAVRASLRNKKGGK